MMQCKTHVIMIMGAAAVMMCIFTLCCVNIDGDSRLSAMHVYIESEEFDSIRHNRAYKADAELIGISVEGDTIFNDLVEIKSRGNSTFLYSEKKSYSIKTRKKVSLLGIRKGKSFALQANTFDKSFVRNAIAFDLAEVFGLPVPSYTYCRLYVNDKYEGLYQLTNRIKVEKNGLNINDLGKDNKLTNSLPLDIRPFSLDEKGLTWCNEHVCRRAGSKKGFIFEFNPEDITGGYILDNSGYGWVYEKSPSGFVSAAGDPIRIRAPKYASQEEVTYIAQIYDSMEHVIIHNSTDSNGHYSRYIDVNSFVRYYILQEIIENADAGKSSFYMYKDIDEVSPKFFAGPVWDCDHTLGHTPCPACNDYHALYAASELGTMDGPHSGSLLYHLYRHPDFREQVRRTYVDDVRPKVMQYIESNRIDSLAELIGNDARKESKYFNQQVKEIELFLKDRIDFLDWVWSISEENLVCVIVQYNFANGTDNDRWVRFYLPKGVPVTISVLNEPINERIKYRWRYKNTGELVRPNTVFQENDTIIRTPTKLTQCYRSLKKK